MGDKERKEVDPSALAELIHHLEEADSGLWSAHWHLAKMNEQDSATAASISRIQNELQSLIAELHPTVCL